MGGGIAAAFTDQFPYLVDEGVALIASAGLMEVCWPNYLWYPIEPSHSQVKFPAQPNLCLHRLCKLWLQADLFVYV